MKRFLPQLFLITQVCLSCTGNPDDKKTLEEYEQGKTTLTSVEKKTPQKFITVSNSTKKNILGQIVIKGVIVNHAKVVTYKDVAIKLSFFSKTGALLEQDEETIYVTIDPGASEPFKSKYFAAKGTDSVSISVLNAKY